LINSVHDISEGGLFVACAESAMAGGKGFDICSDNSVRLDAWLYGESQSRVVLSLSADKWLSIQELATKYSLPALHIGTVTSNEVIVNGQNWGSLDSFKLTYQNSIAEKLA
jgi:phosphoribosylformylglycinamidine synthase